MVGLYTEDQIRPTYNNDGVDTFAVDAEIVDKLWTPVIYDKRVGKMLLNTKENRRKLGIRKDQLKGGMSDISIWQITELTKEFVDAILKEVTP
jgi:hypothetical protein